MTNAADWKKWTKYMSENRRTGIPCMKFDPVQENWSIETTREKEETETEFNNNKSSNKC